MLRIKEMPFLGTANFKISRGSMPPDPHRGGAPPAHSFTFTITIHIWNPPIQKSWLRPWYPLQFSCTCQGHSPGEACCPPRILLANFTWPHGPLYGAVKMNKQSGNQTFYNKKLKELKTARDHVATPVLHVKPLYRKGSSVWTDIVINISIHDESLDKIRDGLVLVIFIYLFIFFFWGGGVRGDNFRKKNLHRKKEAKSGAMGKT